MKVAKDSPEKHLQQGELPHMQQEIEKPRYRLMSKRLKIKY